MTAMELYVRGRLTCVRALIELSEGLPDSTVGALNLEACVLRDILQKTSLYGDGEPLPAVAEEAKQEQLIKMNDIVATEEAWNKNKPIRHFTDADVKWLKDNQSEIPHAWKGTV